MVRDVVEIVAILAAGIWAFYVFVYENRIKPSLLQPDVTISGSMQRVGQVRGLDAIQLTVTANNVGTMAVKFLAYSLTVVGNRVVESTTASRPLHSPFADQFQRHFRVERPVTVYRRAYLTHDADPRSQQGLNIQPGATSRSDMDFYVPHGRYDRLLAIFAGRIQRQADPPLKTTMTIGPDGIPVIGGPTNSSDAVEDDRVTVATLTLPSR